MHGAVTHPDTQTLPQADIHHMQALHVQDTQDTLRPVSDAAIHHKRLRQSQEEQRATNTTISITDGGVIRPARVGYTTSGRYRPSR